MRVTNLLALLALPALLHAQIGRGHPIGKVSVIGNLIHLELDSAAVSPERVFDLDHRTLRFTPDIGGYRIENTPLHWEDKIGAPVHGASVTFKHFEFRFNGKMWNTANVANGAITFGAMNDIRAAALSSTRIGNSTGAGINVQGGFAMGRYPHLETLGLTFINMIPGIAAFVKPDLAGQRFIREFDDRVVITWELTEPSANLEAFTWAPTVNRIQAVLYNDGAIELSYNGVSARDAIVGVFPILSPDATKQYAAFFRTGAVAEGFKPPVIDLSETTKSDGPFLVAYEEFHWASIPRSFDVACSIIRALGDKFDFIASYSDFRIDNPEPGSPSSGPGGRNVSGIGKSMGGLSAYCSQGQLQWMYVEPVPASSVMFQERSPDGRMRNYDYAMSLIGHEMGHRWAAEARALVNGDTIILGPVHWASGMHVPAAFPYSSPTEADAMGGSTWKDNGNGTYTQLDPAYMSPAKGYSWLDLYLMGLAKPEEVKPFFILRNLKWTGGRDANDRPIFTGNKTVITIENVIAAMGPRVPDFEHSQKTFNTAIVVMTMPGKAPTRELLSNANAIAEHWIAYWSKTTGGRSVMTVLAR